MQSASYFRLVTLIIPGIAGGNTGNQFTFPDQPDIRYARTTRIKVYTADDLTHSQPQPAPVLANQDLAKCTLTLMTNDPDDPTRLPNGQKAGGENGRNNLTLETVRWIPLTELHANQGFGVAPASFNRSVPTWKDTYITWQKSFITVAPGGLGNTADIAIVLGVFYTFMNEKGQPIIPRN